MRRIALLFGVLLSTASLKAAVISSTTVKTIYNPYSGRFDFITVLDTNSIQAGTGVTVVQTSSGVSISATGGGGGSGALEVFSNFDATTSSPTASISIGDSLKLAVSGSTASLVVDFSTVPSRSDALLNSQTLESKTIFVASGSVYGPFTARQTDAGATKSNTLTVFSTYYTQTFGNSKFNEQYLYSQSTTTSGQGFLFLYVSTAPLNQNLTLSDAGFGDSTINRKPGDAYVKLSPGDASTGGSVGLFTVFNLGSAIKIQSGEFQVKGSSSSYFESGANGSIYYGYDSHSGDLNRPLRLYGGALLEAISANADTDAITWGTVVTGGSSNKTGQITMSTNTTTYGLLVRSIKAGSASASPPIDRVKFTREADDATAEFQDSVEIRKTNGLGLLKFPDSSNAVYANFKSSAVMTSSYTIVWPSSLGSAGQVLQILSVNGSTASTSFVTPSFGGGSGSSLAITTGNASGYTGAIVSSPTAVVVFSSQTFKLALINGNTVFAELNPSSVTLLGAKIDVGEINATGTPSSSNVLRGDGTWAVVQTTSPSANPCIEVYDSDASISTRAHATICWNLTSTGDGTENITTVFTQIVNGSTVPYIVVSSQTVNISTLTIGARLFDYTGSSGTAGQFFGAQSNLPPKWQTPAGGGAGITGSTTTITLNFDNGGAVLQSGVNGSTACSQVPFSATVSSWTVFVTPPLSTGSISVRIRKSSDGLSTFSAMSLGGMEPGLTSQRYNTGPPTSWSSTSISQGNFVCGEIISADTLTNATVQLWGIR